MIGVKESLAIILVVAITTFFTRALPFLIFKNTSTLPEKVVYLGKSAAYGDYALSGCILFT